MIISRTPYRFSFFGGGTDYPGWYRKHGGQVLSTTIDKYLYISCRYLPPFFEHRLRLVYSQIEACQNSNELDHPSAREVLKFLGIENVFITGIDYSKNQYLPNPPNRCRYPSTLYAAGKRFIVTGWLLILTFWQSFKPGFIFWNFVFWEGLGRIIVDFYREDTLWKGFTIGQWFSSIMVIIALYFFVKYYKKDWKKIFSK